MASPVYINVGADCDGSCTESTGAQWDWISINPTPAMKYTSWSGMTCVSNNWHSAWRTNTDCSAEILADNMGTWGDGNGVHFTEWMDISFPSPRVLTSTRVYYWSGQYCDFNVQTSADGSTWTTACTVGSTSTANSLCNSGYPTTGVSYYRLSKASATPCWGSDTWLRINGIEFFGHDPVTA